MADLATDVDVAEALGRPLSTEEETKVGHALARASAFVRAKTGRKFEAGPRVVRKRPREGRVWLDSPASVESIVSIRIDGATQAVEGWTLEGPYVYGIGISPFSQNTFAYGYPVRWVKVSYTASEEVPLELIGLTADLVGRLITSPAVPGVSYEIAGPFARGFSKDAVAAVLLPDESTVLAQFRAPRGSIDLT